MCEYNERNRPHEVGRLVGDKIQIMIDDSTGRYQECGTPYEPNDPERPARTLRMEMWGSKPQKKKDKKSDGINDANSNDNDDEDGNDVRPLLGVMAITNPSDDNRFWVLKTCTMA